MPVHQLSSGPVTRTILNKLEQISRALKAWNLCGPSPSCVVGLVQPGLGITPSVPGLASGLAPFKPYESSSAYDS